MKKNPLLTLLLLIASCSVINSTAANTNIIDDHEPKARIISVGSSITELFFALGAEDQLVAVDVTSRHYIKDSALAQVGYHRQLSAEGLMALNPSDLIGSNEMGPEKTLEQLKAAQVNVIEVPSGNSQEALIARINLIATITHTQDKAVALTQSVVQSIAQLRQQKLSSTPNVLFMMINEKRPATVAGANTSIDKIITLAGAVNPAATMDSYKSMSYEAIIALQPDYILVSQHAWDQFGGKVEIVRKLPLLAATPAGSQLHIMPVASSAIIGGFGLESIALAEQLNQLFMREQTAMSEPQYDAK